MNPSRISPQRALHFALVLSLTLPVLAFAGPHQSLVARADALVTVKYVLSVKAMGHEQELENETTCLMIDTQGLVLCSNTELGGTIAMMGQIFGSGADITATPKQIEILVASETEGRPASLIARDTDRDLAWIQLDEAPEEPLSTLDFNDNATLDLGDPFFRLRRMHRHFGRAALVEEGTIGAVIEKPRRLYAVSNPTQGGFGAPVFNSAGKLVGLTVLQSPNAEDDSSAQVQASALLGNSAQLQDIVAGLILPASEVVKATRLARESLAADEESE